MSQSLACSSWDSSGFSYSRAIRPGYLSDLSSAVTTVASIVSVAWRETVIDLEQLLPSLSWFDRLDQ